MLSQCIGRASVGMIIVFGISTIRVRVMARATVRVRVIVLIYNNCITIIIQMVRFSSEINRYISSHNGMDFKHREEVTVYERSLPLYK